MTNVTIYTISKLIILASVLQGVAGCGEGEPKKATGDETAIQAIHQRVLTLDSHVDISPDYTYNEDFDPGRMGKMKVDLPKMAHGGLDAAFFIVYVGQTARTAENYHKAKQAALRKFDAIHRMTDMLYPERIGLARTPADVRRIYKDGRKVAIIGIENGYAIGRDLSLVADYYQRGARYMTLAHNGHNDICDSAQPKEDLGDAPAEHGGVSDFGKKVIAEMNRVGMMVDISHVSEDCMIQATKLSQAPVIASHSGVRALAGHPRNLTDAQMKLLAAKGGVMQTVAFSGYVKHDPARSAAREELEQKIAAQYGYGEAEYDKIMETPEWQSGAAEIDARHPVATVAEYVDHIDYAVRLMGIDHVGISSDFDGGGGIAGWNDAAETLNITRELVARGYSEEDIAKIWGGNLLRVWREADRVAADMRDTSAE